MDQAPLLLAQLLDELQKLNPTLTADTDQPVAGRVSLRAGDGHLVGGDALLSEKALAALLDAVRSLNAYAAQATPGLTIPPDLEADFEEYCIGLPVDQLISMAATDPQRAVNAFDSITYDMDNGDDL